MKTACFAKKLLSHTAADDYFKSHGMKLFSITTAQDYSELQHWTTILYEAGSSHWVDGTSSNGQWLTSDGQPIHKDVIPTVNLDKGTCVTILCSDYHGTFPLIATNCEDVLTSYGEYVDSSKIVTTTTTSST